jgi:hypothetical protein
MSTVPFAVVCDLCGTRGEEYQGAHQCIDCGRDVCNKCGINFDADYSYEGPEEGWRGAATCLCKPCAAERDRVSDLEANDDDGLISEADRLGERGSV